MNDSETGSKLKKIVLSIALLVIAAGVAVYFLIPAAPPQRLAYYYDLGTEKIFTAPATVGGPIDAPSKKSVDGEGAGMLAAVYSCGSCANTAEHKVAFIEKISSDAKQALAEVEKQSAKHGKDDVSPQLMRDLKAKLDDGQFIALPSAEPNWVKTSSEQGLAIKAEAEKLCGGVPPKRCQP